MSDKSDVDEPIETGEPHTAAGDQGDRMIPSEKGQNQGGLGLA
jgi:hypothetical protein